MAISTGIKPSMSLFDHSVVEVVKDVDHGVVRHGDHAVVQFVLSIEHAELVVVVVSLNNNSSATRQGHCRKCTRSTAMPVFR